MDQTRLWVNYFYFGILFALLATLSASSLYLREIEGPYLVFFLLTSIGQAFLEVSLLLCLGWLVRLFLPRIFYPFYIAFTFMVLILHLMDFCLERVIDLSVWDALSRFVFDETFDNFLQLLDASGIPLWVWIASFSALVALPFLGILVYWITDWLSQLKPLSVRADLFIQFLFLLPISLFLWDFTAAHLVKTEVHDSILKSLPWKVAFLHPRHLYLSLPSSLPPAPSEEEVLRQVAAVQTTRETRPNIFLFITESLREDYITQIVAPNLSRFREENLSFPFAYSNANASNLSWFSIFHSRLPQYWKSLSDWRSGSPALQALKRLGYKVRVYTSAGLAYYGMDELIFGNEMHLVDHYESFPHGPLMETWQSDEMALASVLRDLQAPENQTGQLYVIFWDSTHFEYSWPSDRPLTFQPITHEMNYFLAFQSPQKIELIRNRYRNALHYVDELFGKFLSQMPKKEEAMIAFLGDHGEEFFEHGHLFHLSHLTEEQTHIPFYLKLPYKPLRQATVASQIDLFPTLLDALGVATPFLQGESLLSPEHRDVAITSRFNAKRTPFEFAIENGRSKLIAQFSDPDQIFHSPYLRIVALHGIRDEPLRIPREDLESWLKQEFGSAFDRHFNGRPIRAEMLESLLHPPVDP